MAVGMINFSTVNGTTDFVKKSFAGMITRLMPNGSAPLFGLTSMLKDETAVQVEHGFFTKTMIFPAVTINASQLAGDTTLTVVSTTNILPGMILRNQTTGEEFIINTVASGTSITVTRAVGTVAAASMFVSQVCYQTGNALKKARTVRRLCLFKLCALPILRKSSVTLGR